MRRRWGLVQGVAALVVVASAVVVGGASTADARPAQPAPTTECADYADRPAVEDLCEAFADFELPAEAVEMYCLDSDTSEIDDKCDVSTIPDDQLERMVGAWHFNRDAACQESRAHDWYEVEVLNDGFPRIYERVCLRASQRVAPADWTKEDFVAIGIIMAMEGYDNKFGDLPEPVCVSWNPGNWDETFFYHQLAGDIRVPMNTICDTLNELGWPAYKDREDPAHLPHPGCDAPPSDGSDVDPMSAFIPDDCWGTYPATKYDIGYEPGEWHEFSRWMWGNSTAFAYNIGKGAVSLSLWAVDWAFVDFNIKEYDEDLGENVGRRFRTNLIFDPDFPLIPLAWLILLSWAGYTALRRRVGMAGSEIVMSIVLVGLSAVLLDNQRLYMDETWGLMDRASTALLAAGQGDDPVDYEQPDDADPEVAREYRTQLIDEVQRDIFMTFVELPYDYLSWGEPLGDADDDDNPLRNCAAARDEAVSRGPWDTGDEPRDAMREAGDDCEQFATFNASSNGTRLLGAVLTMVAGFVLAVLLTLVSLTVVVAKLVAVLVFALAPFAALTAILPGYGRRLAWSWVTALIQVVIAVVGMGFLLSFLLLITGGVLESTADVDLVERFAVLNIMVFVVYFARKRLLANSQSLAGRLGDYWAATRGSGTPWTGAGPGAGVDLLGADRVVTPPAKVAATAAGVAAILPVALTGRTIATRWRERRVIRRQYRNLRRVSNWKYGQFGVP
jgi:hypothetical protein